MDQTHRFRRIGITAVLCAALLRLTVMGSPEKVAAFLTKPNIAAFLIYLETGRDVRFSTSLQVFSPHFSESPPPSVPKATEPSLPSFSGEETVELYRAARVSPDTAALLAKPLQWNLTDTPPAVLILHTHTTESYTKTEETYPETARWRTLEETYNMLSIGSHVAELLTEAGIGVIQDRTLHDYPSYNGSYVHARKAIQETLKEYPSIRLILDLHRDASTGDGGQLRPLVQGTDIPTAQLMLVLGTNHSGYEENLSLALKLHVQLEALRPGITRPLQLRAQRFNQDLSPGALLVEVGAAGNTHAEAIAAAEILAKAVIALARGSA